LLLLDNHGPKNENASIALLTPRSDIFIEFEIVDVKWTIVWFSNLKDQFAAPVFEKIPQDESV
jgi:hypothetical protein